VWARRSSAGAHPFHPLGVLFWEASGGEHAFGLVPPGAEVPFEEVLAARAGRVAMVRDRRRPA
jgi:hypothetical protein